jgi:hypothetical protein
MKFTESDIKNINQLFEDPLNAGYVLNFTNKSMREFFESELSIDIDNDIYRKDGDSKMKRLRCLLKQDDRETVLRVVTRLWEYRKTIPDNVITAQDDAVYGKLISKIQGADSLAAAGKTPALIVPTGIDNNIFLKVWKPSITNRLINGDTALNYGLTNYLPLSIYPLKAHSG